MTHQPPVKLHFSDYFEVEPETIKEVGAFNVSLINDLPLFIDPFLLFTSSKPEYAQLHDGMIKYLRFLRNKSLSGPVGQGLIDAWYKFPEVKQTWLGFSRVGNQGRGLGGNFALALHRNLRSVFTDFGSETITRGTHLEKLCLIGPGVGRDNISDFTTNLIKGFLLDYTQAFAVSYMADKFTSEFTVRHVRFNYEMETWEHGCFRLPLYNDDFVLLTPKDILTKDDTWINRRDMVHDFYTIVSAVPDQQLRDQLNNHFIKHLPEKDNPTPKETRTAIERTFADFPELIEYYIRYKEDHGDQAQSFSKQKVADTELLFIQQLRQFVTLLQVQTAFYEVRGNTLTEARARVMYMKDIIENKGGYRLFYLRGVPIEREADLQIVYRMTWFGTPSDVSREVNDGRGPADFKISRGSQDKTIVEFKLASNPALKRNLEKQLELYKQASDAQHGVKAIMYFSEGEQRKVQTILQELSLSGDPNVILIDARQDNKPSASKA